MGQVTFAALTIEDEVPDYLLPLFEFLDSVMSLGESREFNPFVEFRQLFPATTPNGLLPFRTINHRICPKPQLYMCTQVATLTLQILRRAHETAHRRRSLRPDL